MALLNEPHGCIRIECAIHEPSRFLFIQRNQIQKILHGDSLRVVFRKK